MSGYFLKYSVTLCRMLFVADSDSQSFADWPASVSEKGISERVGTDPVSESESALPSEQSLFLLAKRSNAP